MSALPARSALRALFWLALGLVASCGSLTADFICSDNASCLSASGIQGTCATHAGAGVLPVICWPQPSADGRSL